MPTDEGHQFNKAASNLHRHFFVQVMRGVCAGASSLPSYLLGVSFGSCVLRSLFTGRLLLVGVLPASSTRLLNSTTLATLWTCSHTLDFFDGYFLSVHSCFLSSGVQLSALLLHIACTAFVSALLLSTSHIYLFALSPATGV